MICYNCGCELTELDFCTNCGADVKQYKKILYTADALYNEGLERATVRDLSGAARALRDCIRFNKGILMRETFWVSFIMRLERALKRCLNGLSARILNLTRMLRMNISVLYRPAREGLKHSKTQ